MGSNWTTTPPILKSPDGEPFNVDDGHDYLRLLDRLNAMQAVVAAADMLLAYQGNRREEEFWKDLRTSLNQLETKK